MYYDQGHGTCMEQLLGMDADWPDLRGEGYVKQTVSGGTSSSCKLRAIIPNSTVLRLLTNVVKLKVRAYSDAYSEQHMLDHKVLGSSRGGQPMDITGSAMLTLQ